MPKIENKQLMNVNIHGPFIWVTYYEENPKFGISYVLNSHATGMKFNDSTCMITNGVFTKIKYYDSVTNKDESNKREEVYDL
jgi:hypothetical protein